MGCVLSAGQGQNPARQAAIGAGLPPAVGAVTINKVCGSGLKAVVFGAHAIGAGEHDVVVAGGMESMSNAPYLLPKARDGYRLGHAQVIDSLIQDGLWDAYGNVHMGDCAELCAREKKVSARRAGRLRRRIVPPGPGRAGRRKVHRRDRAGGGAAAERPAEGDRRRRGAVAWRSGQAGKLAARLPEGRHRHRRQRVLHQRRRRRPGAGRRRRGGRARLEGRGAHHRQRHLREFTGMVHHRARRRDRASAEEGRLDSGGRRSLGDQRGLLRGGGGQQPDAGPRSRKGECVGRRGGAGASHRRQRRSGADHVARRAYRIAAASAAWRRFASEAAKGLLWPWNARDRFTP